MATGKMCAKHGGNCNPWDAGWLCDECARAGISKCTCGGHARIFGEALMVMVSCESCKQSVSRVGYDIDIKKLWNDGVRGHEY